MISTFLDKASGILGRRFLLAYWAPVWVAVWSGLTIGIGEWGVRTAWTWWNQQSLPTQLWLPIYGLLGVTIVAYLFQAFTRSLVRLYEGYWPPRMRGWLTAHVARRWQRIKTRRAKAAKDQLPQYAAYHATLYYQYPPLAEFLLPTRLGNVFRSAELYSATTYGLDAVFWWPRLAPILPPSFHEEVQEAFTPVLMMLNLATLAVLVGVGGAAFLAWRHSLLAWYPLIVLVVALTIARLAYEGAVAQAQSYGLYIRAAFDLHRFDLLSALHQPLPPSPDEERKIWAQLEDWLYNQNRGVAAHFAYWHKKN